MLLYIVWLEKDQVGVFFLQSYLRQKGKNLNIIFSYWTKLWQTLVDFYWDN